MKNTKSYLALFFLLLFAHNTMMCQSVKFNPELNIKQANHQYYIGRDKNKNFALGSFYEIFGKSEKIFLLVYDSKFSEPQSIELGFTHKFNGLVSAYLSKESTIVMIYYSAENRIAGYYQEVFNETGAFISVKTIDKNEKGGIFSNSMSNLYRSSDYNWFLHMQKNSMKIMDKDFKVQGERKIEKSYSNFRIFKDGSVLIENNGTKKEPDALIKFSSNGTRNELKLKENWISYIDEDAGKLYVVYQNGEPAKFLISFKARDFDLFVYNLKDLSLENKYPVPFLDEIMVKATDSNQVGRLKGIPNLQLNRIITTDKEPIVVFEIYYVTTALATSSPGPGSGMRTTHISNFEDILLIGIHNDGHTTQKIIDREAQMEVYRATLGKMLTLYQDGELYVLFNNAADSKLNLVDTKYKLEVYAFNKDLEATNHLTFESSEEHDINLIPITATRYSAHKYLIFGSNLKYSVSAFLILGKDKDE